MTTSSTPHAETDPVVLPTSFAQELFWLVDRAAPGSTAYHTPRTRRLRGHLDVEALHRAFNALAERHEILRTTYTVQEDHPMQVIHAPGPVDFTVVDCTHLPPSERAAEGERIVRVRTQQTFDLSREIPLRVAVIKLADDEHLLHVDSHHIATDGWSRDILFRELDALYGAIARGETPALAPLPIQYADFAIWQRQQLTGDRLDALLSWWRAHLEGADSLLCLPTDFPRPAVPGTGGIMRSIVLPPETVAAVRALGQRAEATLYMTLLTAYMTVLHRYTGQPDILVGSPVAGRARPETEGLIGYFANTVVQRGRFANDPTFLELLTQVRDGALGAYEHQDVPFEKLVLELQQGQALSHSPLFQVVFTMLEAADPATTRLGDVTVHSVGADAGVTKFDLTLFMADRPEGLTLALRARSDLFAPASVERFLGHLHRVLDSAVAEPRRRISELAVLTHDEEELLAAANATSVDVGAPATIAALIERVADRAPHTIAVRAADGTLTYAELDARANRLANHLRAIGIAAGASVGICLERSAAAVVAIVGVLKAGGSYVPLAPDAPAARVAQQLASCGARVVITRERYVDRLPRDVRAIDLARDAAALARAPETRPAPASAPTDVAYVLFTSGSTGVPKGVAVTHDNLASYVRAVSRVLADVPAGTPGDGLAAMSGWSFGLASTLAADLGNTTLFPALCAGGTLVVLDESITTDPTRWAEVLAGPPLDVLKLTPSHLRALVGDRAGAELARALPARWVVLGGEALRWDLAERILAAGRCRVLNHYGPTEATVGCSTFEVTAASAVQARTAGAQTAPIGRPLANVRLSVLDAHGQRVPLMVPGELYVGGSGVARGYLGRDDLTAERFVQVPTLGRAYRTGDRVRWLPDGTIEFLGRIDQQVKVRGYRVELEEIDQVLREHGSVAQCAVVLRGAERGDAQLVAFVVPRTSGYAAAHAARATTEELAAWVGQRLPDYMVPSTVVLLDQLPLMPNGKLDRAALAARAEDGSRATHECVAPRTPTEERLVAIWADALKKPAGTIGVTDDFLALGGHSLVAIRILGKLSRSFGVRLPLRTLFDAPTVEQLAQRVELEVKLAAVENMSDDEAARLLGGSTPQGAGR